MVVFDTRLGLAVLDVVDSVKAPAARLVVAELQRRTMKTTDGYAARDALSHPLFTALATDREAQDFRALLHVCAFVAGMLPLGLDSQPATALRTSERVVRWSLDHPERACTIGQG